MKNIKVKCPAKINLTLEVVNRREDGFHNIKSVMQLISLYDFLDIKVEKSEKNEIILDGTSSEIPYNEKNLVHKAAQLFLTEASLEGYKLNIFIEKNIPIAAGLAGGSTDGAGAIWGLNKLFGEPLSREKLHEICAKLGSDLNVCLEGGCLLTSSRGEKVEKLNVADYPVTLIKPKQLGISAGEAYTKYDKKPREDKDYTGKMITALKTGKDIKQLLYNDLEYAVFDDYEELQKIKQKLPNSIMSGSGSTYFVLEDCDVDLGDSYQVIKGLKFVETGVEKA